jgi:hypothetical protein
MRKTCRYCGRRWVHGETRCPECGVTRQGIDLRHTVFKVGLPEQADDFCEVQICVGNPALNELAAVGVFLCAVKGASEVAQGDRKRSVATLATAGRILAELDGFGEVVTLPAASCTGVIHCGSACSSVMLSISLASL